MGVGAYLKSFSRFVQILNTYITYTETELIYEPVRPLLTHSLFPLKNVFFTFVIVKDLGVIQYSTNIFEAQLKNC